MKQKLLWNLAPLKFNGGVQKAEKIVIMNYGRISTTGSVINFQYENTSRFPQDINWIIRLIAFALLDSINLYLFSTLFTFTVYIKSIYVNNVQLSSIIIDFSLKYYRLIYRNNWAKVVPTKPWLRRPIVAYFHREHICNKT